MAGDVMSVASSRSPYLVPERMKEGFKASMENELFGRTLFLENTGWLEFAKISMGDNYFFGYGWNNKYLNFLFAVIYRPFLMFDLASAYSFKIDMLKAMVTGRGDWDQDLMAYQRKGWFLGLFNLPRFAQLVELKSELPCN